MCGWAGWAGWTEWVSTATIDSGFVQAAYLLTAVCCLHIVFCLGPALNSFCSLSAVCSLASGRDDADGGREMTRKGGDKGVKAKRARDTQ
ncbi:hypothetical protein BKA59DRAFT_476941 [Fusarium tricinctum]|uniref:Uncharacterized protein n=1 Tax=Fusarium tricinctum TaxID=61284 RepID=A0A8K0WBB8_9HYPO|nr:hypothetical protein BKA59DRAFT_476941 [Fusarium tricinctum]